MLNILMYLMYIFVSRAICAAPPYPKNQTSIAPSSLYDVFTASKARTFASVSAASSSIHSKACCFVVQDTVNVAYWADYTTYRWTSKVNATIVVTSLTEYTDTTVTNVEWEVVPTTATGFATRDKARKPASFSNQAPAPTSTYTRLNGTTVSTYGTTITSPAPFYVYSRVKVISVPAVYGKDGYAVCATTSTYVSRCQATATSTNSVEYPGVNSYAEAYYSGRGGGNGSSAIPIPETGLEVALSTPFIYLRPKGAGGTRFNETSNLDFGYVFHELIDWMAGNPEYASQYPDIASCLPGGPSIKYQPCVAAPNVPPNQVAYAASGLTSSSQVTVTSAGCFRPGACSASPLVAAKGPTLEPTPLPAIEAKLPIDPVPDVEARPSVAGPSVNQPSVVAAGPNQAIPVVSTASPGIQPDNAPTRIDLNSLAPEQLAALHAALAAPGTPELGTTVPASPDAYPQIQNIGAAQPPVESGGLGAFIADAMGVAPAGLLLIPSSSPNSGPELIPASPAKYTVKLVPSASAVIINGITTNLPAIEPAQTPAPQTFTVGSRVVTLQPAVPDSAPGQMGSPQPSTTAQYIVGSQTLRPGGPAISIANTPISIPSLGDSIRIGSEILPLPTPIPAAQNLQLPPLVIGSQTFTPNSNSQYIIGSQTLSPNSPATVNLPAPTQPRATPITIGTEILTPNPTATAYLLAGTTLHAGGPALTISNTPIFLLPSNSGLFIGSSTIPFPTLLPTAPTSDQNQQPPQLIKLGTETFAPNPTAFSIAGTTISANGPGITVAGIPVSIEAGDGEAAVVVVGESRISFPTSDVGSRVTLLGSADKTRSEDATRTGTASETGSRMESVTESATGSVGTSSEISTATSASRDVANSASAPASPNATATGGAIRLGSRLGQVGIGFMITFMFALVAV